MAKSHQISIYQLKEDKVEKNFRSYASIIAEFGGIKLSDYDKVYEFSRATTQPNTYLILDEIYALLNGVHPEGYKGHSLSVSDIILLDGTMYYVDKYGFQKIDMIM